MSSMLLSNLWTSVNGSAMNLDESTSTFLSRPATYENAKAALIPTADTPTPTRLAAFRVLMARKIRRKAILAVWIRNAYPLIWLELWHLNCAATMHNQTHSPESTLQFSMINTCILLNKREGYTGRKSPLGLGSTRRLQQEVRTEKTEGLISSQHSSKQVW